MGFVGGGQVETGTVGPHGQPGQQQADQEAWVLQTRLVYLVLYVAERDEHKRVPCLLYMYSSFVVRTSVVNWNLQTCPGSNLRA